MCNPQTWMRQRLRYPKKSCALSSRFCSQQGSTRRLICGALPKIGRHARILSVGGYRGSRVVDNDEMCTIIDSTPEWIEQRTGIQERRWATDEETPLFMAVAAARKAIDRAGLDPSRIDGIICSTVSHFQQSPSLAVYVAHELGLSAGPVAFDISPS